MSQVKHRLGGVAVAVREGSALVGEVLVEERKPLFFLPLFFMISFGSVIFD